MQALLIQIAKWLLRFAWDETVLLAADGKLVKRAGQLAADQDASCSPGTSGEYKRHQVYARLQDEFPFRRKKELALSIEVAKWFE